MSRISENKAFRSSSPSSDEGATANEVLFPPPLCFPSFSSPQHNLARLLSLSPPFGSAAKSRKSMACKGERAKEPKTRLDDRGKKSLTKNLPARQSARQYKAFKEPKMQRRNSYTCQTGWWKKRNNGSFFLCFFLFSSEGGVGSIFASFLTAVLRGGGGGLALEEKPAIC